MADEGVVACEVAYARPDRQFVVKVTLPRGATAQDALLKALESGLAVDCPEIAPEAVLGIFGRVVPAQQVLRDGDRVEIYRPLAADPRNARLERVTAARKSRR